MHSNDITVFLACYCCHYPNHCVLIGLLHCRKSCQNSKLNVAKPRSPIAYMPFVWSSWNLQKARQPNDFVPCKITKTKNEWIFSGMLNWQVLKRWHWSYCSLALSLRYATIHRYATRQQDIATNYDEPVHLYASPGFKKMISIRNVTRVKWTAVHCMRLLQCDNITLLSSFILEKIQINIFKKIRYIFDIRSTLPKYLRLHCRKIHLEISYAKYRQLLLGLIW